ncbi:hypothetical protein F5Y19DRAFT_318279 [Xylariaceae sp. FL1651]|nr:hypothetical protein F5Y19DRAFT_318279 [Xylariaceae sp. FL1651]
MASLPVLRSHLATIPALVGSFVTTVRSSLHSRALSASRALRATRSLVGGLQCSASIMCTAVSVPVAHSQGGVKSDPS